MAATTAAPDVVTLADGRALDVLLGGAPDGVPLVLHDGTPSDATAWADLDFLDGMGPENVDEFGAAMAGEEDLRAWMADNAEPFRAVTGPELAEAFGGLVPQIDKDVLTGGYADAMAATTRRALEHGLDGWVDDDLAFTRPWGFDLAATAVPVTVWQGDLDLMVPFAHGPWLAQHLPRATARTAPGHGHISLVTRFRGEILDGLVTAARA